MIQTHKIFLIWLLYAIVMVFTAAVFVASGIPKLAISYDHSHLTVLLGILYVVAEVLSGKQAWKISNEHRVSVDVLKYTKINDIKIDGEKVALYVDYDVKNIEPSITSSHISNLVMKSRNGANLPIDQTILLDTSEDELYHQISMGEFISSRIVWIGIFATILGVIMAFWPLLQTGFDLETMKSNLGGFFGGIAVAFIPTAASFIFKIALDVNTRILERGVQSTLNNISKISEISIIPFLEREKSSAPQA